jgi:hypothetical protein
LPAVLVFSIGSILFTAMTASIHSSRTAYTKTLKTLKEGPMIFRKSAVVRDVFEFPALAGATGAGRRLRRNV